MASPYIKCPYCGSRMRTAGHKTITPMYKRLIATCQNPKCLASVAVNIEIAKQLHPSLLPIQAKPVESAKQRETNILPRQPSLFPNTENMAKGN